MSAVLVTGAQGFVGRELVRVLRQRGGHAVLPRSALGGGPWRLGDPLEEDLVRGLDAAVHLAWEVRRPALAEACAEATSALIRHLAARGVRRQVFVSSMSAGPHATSAYGRGKYRVEREIAGVPGVAVVRPGLVRGGGGLYGRMAAWARRLPVVPLPDGGRARLGLIDVGVLAVCLADLALGAGPVPTQPVVLTDPGGHTLRDIVRGVAPDKPIVAVPAAWMRAGLRLAGALRLPVPVHEDNLLGLVPVSGKEEAC